MAGLPENSKNEILRGGTYFTLKFTLTGWDPVQLSNARSLMTCEPVGGFCRRVGDGMR